VFTSTQPPPHVWSGRRRTPGRSRSPGTGWSHAPSHPPQWALVGARVDARAAAAGQPVAADAQPGRARLRVLVAPLFCTGRSPRSRMRPRTSPGPGEHSAPPSQVPAATQAPSHSSCPSAHSSHEPAATHPSLHATCPSGQPPSSARRRPCSLRRPPRRRRCTRSGTRPRARATSRGADRQGRVCADLHASRRVPHGGGRLLPVRPVRVVCEVRLPARGTLVAGRALAQTDRGRPPRTVRAGTARGTRATRSSDRPRRASAGRARTGRRRPARRAGRRRRRARPRGTSARPPPARRAPTTAGPPPRASARAARSPSLVAGSWARRAESGRHAWTGPRGGHGLLR
jgi:hypothetical protein